VAEGAPTRGSWRLGAGRGLVIDTPAWARDAIFYQVFPDRFAASDRVPKPGPMEPWDAQPTVHGRGVAYQPHRQPPQGGEPAPGQHIEAGFDPGCARPGRRNPIPHNR